MKTIAVTRVLSAAEVNALDSTDINIISAPPAGYQLKPVQFIVSKLSGTAAGSCANDPIALVHTGETTILAALDAVGAATNSNLVLATGTAAASYLTANGDIFSEAITGADATAKGIDVTGQGATIGSFDGTLQVTVVANLIKIG